MINNNLDIRNYDNFKDLSYFIGQYNKALEMMKEVEDFYLSFLKSKLVHSYELDTYPGKIVLKLFKDYIDKKPTVNIKHFDYHFKCDSYDDIQAGKQFQDHDGFWFEVIKCKEKKNTGWTKEYDGPVKKELVIKYLEKPYYYTCALDPIFYFKDRTKGVEDINKVINSCKNVDAYDAQEPIKKQLAELYRKFEKDIWFLPSPNNGELKVFAKESELKNFQFMIKDKYLVVYTKHHTGGTRTDRWKTFEYEGWNWHKFYFEISTGNFFKEEEYLEKTYEHQLNVHNGWHPYDDD